MKLTRLLNSLFTDSTNQFRNASDIYSDEFDKLIPQTTRANSKYSNSVDGIAVSKEIENYVLKPYSINELATYSDAIEKLDLLFSRLTSAFTSLQKSGPTYNVAEQLYKSHRECHVSAIRAYSRAAHCAAIEALMAERRVLRNEFDLMLLEAKTKNPDKADSATIEAKASALKALLIADANSNKMLKDAASDAEGKASILLAKFDDD